MTPYFQEAGITLYHGDCKDILPGLGPFDLLLTDPPYGMNLDTDNSRFSGGSEPHRSRRGQSEGNNRPIIGDDKPFSPDHLLGVAPDAIIWGWNHFADKLPPGACLVWIKRNDSAYGTFLSDAEVAWKSRGCGVFCHRDLTNNGGANDRVHPTQKPVGLMRWCLSQYPKAQTIIDPYAGSGTTLIAAFEQGLTAVGIEIELHYCDIITRRLAKAIRQRPNAPAVLPDTSTGFGLAARKVKP